MDISDITIKSYLEGIKNKQFSVKEFLNVQLDLIKKTDPEVKAFITLDKEGVLEQAEHLSQSEEVVKSKLKGLPVAFKDNYLTLGIETTAGSNILKGYIPQYESTVVTKIKKSGGVVLGKTNMDAFAHGSSTENSDFFTTHNPWDLSRVPGGSSGGSAAAVASGMSLLAFGSDTGGSIRQPAGFCNVVGLKPTYGLVSRHGVVAMGSSTDSMGFFTQDVEDANMVLPLTMGQDEIDCNVQTPNLDFSENNLKRGVKGLKIGLPAEYFTDDLDKGVSDLVKKAISILEKEGAEVIEVTLPNSKYGIPVYYVQISAELSSNLSRFDGIRYHYSILDEKDSLDEVKSFSDIYFQTKGKGFGDEAKRRIMLGTYVLSSGYYDAFYEKARRVRVKIIEDFNDAYKKVDVIITPTSPSVPFKIGEKCDNPLEMHLADIFTVSANLAGIPGLALPAGFIDGLPVGMQIMGPRFSESLLFRVGYHYQQLTDWHKKKPRIKN